MIRLFITFEGGEGAGKTTIIEYIKEFLTKKGYSVLTTREPGGIKIAEQIRSIILNEDHSEMDSKTEALLYAAARRQHLIEKIIPALKDGKVILCDRFIDSSLAYQGFARGLGIDHVYAINQFATDGLLPELTIYFDLDPKVGFDRINKNKQREVNRLDKEKIEFHYLVRKGYHTLLEKYPERIQQINADRPIDDVLKNVKEIVIEKLIKN